MGMKEPGKRIVIDGCEIGEGVPPYIVAELSANHNGEIENAFKIIEHAKLAGANAIKIQTYRPDTITVKCDKPDFQINSGLWRGKSLYDLYEWAHTPWEWHQDLFDRARQLDITIFSSPFDNTAVDLLEDLNAPAYKIASFEAIDLPLIRYVASTRKPMIISTGMANDSEIEEAIDVAKQAGCEQLVVLHCVSGYPAAPEDYNLRTIADMAERFGVLTGLSDHTLSNTTAITAVALGACLIEKHVTLDRSGGGPDDSFSLQPEELRQLCEDSCIAWSALGKISYECKKSEKENLKFRRSLYFIKNAKAGEKITLENVKSIRPGYGLPPKYLDEILGKTLSKDVEFGQAVTWNCIGK
ncbi:pseudaminic acid synthase [Aliikangiella sp. G2MR2-5]|uniref:pseudaminic acid synthase n=1 Tax=Aliikangiella sp. G2MR2-5 TaxID=2788943 RepID=UPI001FEF43D1|nr:pseudaminic acid synthase [Aliikangiella sp. G2MR2-5]